MKGVFILSLTIIIASFSAIQAQNESFSGNEELLALAETQDSSAITGYSAPKRRLDDVVMRGRNLYHQNGQRLTGVELTRFLDNQQYAWNSARKSCGVGHALWLIGLPVMAGGAVYAVLGKNPLYGAGMAAVGLGLDIGGFVLVGKGKKRMKEIYKQRNAYYNKGVTAELSLGIYQCGPGIALKF